LLGISKKKVTKQEGETLSYQPKYAITDQKLNFQSSILAEMAGSFEADIPNISFNCEYDPLLNADG